MAKRYIHTRRRKGRKGHKGHKGQRTRSRTRSHKYHGGFQAPKDDITIGIVCWKSPKTIENTLESYKTNGLFELAHPIIYIQERNTKYEEIAKKYGITQILGGPENTGILQAFIALIEATKTKYFIFAECDFKLVHDKDTTDRVLKEAIKLIKEENVQVVRLRDRENPGDPLVARDFVDATDEELPTHTFDQGNPYKLESIMFLEHPEKAFPNVFKTIDYGSRWYKCADKSCAPWSNNIFIATTNFMKTRALPILRSRPGVNANGRNDNVFAKLENYLADHLTGYNLAQGPGLFTHERLDRGNSNT